MTTMEKLTRDLRRTDRRYETLRQESEKKDERIKQLEAENLRLRNENQLLRMTDAPSKWTTAPYTPPIPIPSWTC